ncbi:unnamed protein product [Chilo suppressalis]|uniref:Major facilitator superfamily (MFS) profile domain-containing protein n=1 Tax=Chilo suppressalis TaxID=168631 RepID=A0ABN8AYI3_CHISP|nr:hypothetical protein evm_009101 [Chilo suppressalis]CAH0401446.1 unnamed protein product [Chilo suppressalis]
MSEVDLTGLAQGGKEQVDSKPLTPMQEVNAALKECGFGIFHARLLLTSFIGIIASVLVSTSTSYLLPSAECDLHMDLVQKGLLNAIPYFGMLFSSVIAGFLTDTFGRKIFITTGLSGIFIFTNVAASSQVYNVLIAAKFFEGFLFATAFSAAVTLTSEFCHNGIRDRVLICQSSFIAMAQIIIACLSWVILTNDWHVSFFDGGFVLNTWNFYLAIMSLWSLVATILYLFIPESPKYLVTQSKFEEARAILLKIYKTNTGNSEENFKYKDLWKKSKATIPEETDKINRSFSHNLVVGLHNTKPMFKRPLVLHLILICTMNFFIMSLYNVLRLWYPQVSTVIEHNSFVTPDGENQNLCGMLDSYTSTFRNDNKTTSDICVPVKSGSETYINSIIIGFICIIPFFISGILVNRIGKKPLLITATMISLAATFSLRFASSKVAVVTLFALNTAILQMLMSLSQAVVIEFFPTTTRTLAISMIMMAGRIGTLVGNVSFPVLLKMACVIPFSTMSGMMLCVVTISMFLPSKKK